MSSERVDAALALLRAEYLETPTLRLTVGEAAELLDLTRTAAGAVLQALENSGFLALTPDGHFGLAPDRRRAAPGVSSGTITDEMVQEYIDAQEGEPVHDDDQFPIDTP